MTQETPKTHPSDKDPRSASTKKPDVTPDVGFDPEDLELLLEWEMPFGRFAGRTLIDLPEEYLMWFAQREFPDGDLGRLMRLCYGIKIHGADTVVKQLRHRLRELNEG